MSIVSRKCTPNEGPNFLFPPPGFSKESQQISKAFNDRLMRATLMQAGVSNANTVSEIYFEQLPDYEEYEYKRPRAKKSYTIEVFVSKKTRGRPLDYRE